uniref:Prostaglandin E synthase n=1 Tax=Caprella sp. KV-2010a TaxID=708586 RepID=S4VIU3_9CRUS|nr:prostaglandin E synthase [Caprella sp. KV-2010a]
MNSVSKFVFNWSRCIKLSSRSHVAPLYSISLKDQQLLSRTFSNSTFFSQSRFSSSQSKSKDANIKSFTFSRNTKLTVGLGLGLGAYLIALDQWNQSKENERTAMMLRTDGLPYIDDKPPEPNVARKIFNPKDQTGIKLTLYQYQTCPFCCKVRAFLDYYGFSYDVVEVNSITRKDVKWSSYKKVPFLIVESPGSTDGETKYIQLKDSSVIISLLGSCLRNPEESLHKLLESFPSYYDKDNGNKLQFANRYFIMYTETKDLERKQKYIKLERKWRQWVDDKFVHTLSPNVYRTPSESLQAFNWFDEVGDWQRLFSSWERFLVIYLGASVMWIIGKRLKKRHNITSDPRISLYDQANLWMREIRTSEGPFMGGTTPNLADLSMYGVLSAIEGCDAFQDLLDNTKIGKWFYKMKKVVLAREGEEKLVKRCSIR